MQAARPELDLDRVWNLAPAHYACNADKRARPPTAAELALLVRRNQAIMNSPHPLKRTLEITLGSSGADGGGQSTSVPSRACSREGPPVNELQDGPEYKFADWIRRSVPSKTIGVYTIWRNADFLYVGMSTDLPTRLNAHASGRRSGDQFNVYLCDRLVVPGLTLDQLRDIERGDLFLDRMTGDYVRQKLTYRYVVCQDKPEAQALERDIRSGLLPAGPPFLNPLR